MVRFDRFFFIVMRMTTNGSQSEQTLFRLGVYTTK